MISRLRLPAAASPLLGLVAVIALFVALMCLKGDWRSLQNFLSIPNGQVLTHGITIPAVLALGMLLIIISGGIDLSVGSVVALVTVVTMQVFRYTFDAAQGSLSPNSAVVVASLLAILSGMAVGALAGMVNGTIITLVRVSPFVATLGMLSVARGLAYWISGRRPIDFPRGARPGWVDALGQVHPGATVFDGKFWDAWLKEPSALDLVGGVWHLFNPGFWSLLVLALAVAALLRYSVLGRYCYAIGSNEATARLCGVPLARTKIVLYVLAGLLTGWAGILMFAQGSSGDPGGGVGLELEVIAAVVIGGASLSGGRGTVLGTLLGVLILGVLSNGVSLFNVPVEIRYILIGGIIVINTALSYWQRRP